MCSSFAAKRVTNIFPGVIPKKEFGDISDHFVIENLIIYGRPPTKLVESLEALGSSFEFSSTISGYR